MKRICSILLAISLLMLLAVGCGAQEAASTEAPASSAETAEVSEAAAPEALPTEVPEASAAEASAEEPEEVPAAPVGLEYPIADGDVSFSYCYEHMPALNSVGIDDWSENPSWMLAEEITGVNLDFVPLAPGTGSDTFALWMASGDLPDISAMFSYDDGMDAAIEDDLIYSLDAYADYCPAFHALLDSNDAWREDCLTDEGQLACFCVMTSETRRMDGGLMIRKDWLDELGLEVPETMDEFTEVLKAFGSNYNAGLGLYSGLATDTYSFCNAYGIAAFNFFEKYWYVVDGEVRMGMIQPEYKDYLTLLHGWYEDGVLNKELIMQMGMSMDGNVDQINASQIGVWSGWVDSMQAWTANIGGDCDIVAMADPVLEKGDQLMLGGPSDSVKGDETFVVTTCCSEPELAIGFMDFFYTEEGSMIANYGVEGVTYEFNENGEPEFTEKITNNELGLPPVNATQAYAIYSIGCYQHLDRYDCMYTDKEISAYEVLKDHKCNAWDYDRFISMTGEENSTYSSVMSDINTYISTAILQFVTGDRPLDEFDQYVEDIKAMDIDTAIAIKQAAYDRVSG